MSTIIATFGRTYLSAMRGILVCHDVEGPPSQSLHAEYYRGWSDAERVDADGGVGSTSQPVTLVNVPQPDQLRRRHDRQHNGEGSSSRQSEPGRNSSIVLYARACTCAHRRAIQGHCCGVVQATGLQRLVFKIPELCDGHWSVAVIGLSRGASTWHRSCQNHTLRYNS